MSKIASNPILSWMIGLTIGYWTFGMIAPGPWLSAMVSAMLLVAGTIVFLTYLPDAYRVVKEGVLGDGQLALIGVTLLAAGSAYSGAFGLAWSFAGNPASWLATVFSSFGRALMIPGFALLLLSPDATREGIKPPRWYLILGGVVGAVLIAFLLGTQVRDAESTIQVMAARAEERECPAGVPIKAMYANRERIYLIPHDRAYAMAKAKACFADEQTAISAGFRPTR